MFLTHFALSTAVFLGILQNETQHLHNPFYVEELKVVTEKLILNSKTEKVYEVKDEGLVSYDTLHRKKRELEMTYEPVCATKVSKVTPKFGEGYYGENKTVLNGNTLNEELNKFIQSVDFVFSQGTNLEIGSEFELTCEQRYTFVQLLVIGESI